MAELKNDRCEVCRIGAPLATERERAEYIRQVPDWTIVSIDNIDRLVRRFKLKNFVEAMAFTNAVADMAEQEGHHPVLVTEWGSVEVSWWSHKIKGLHKNDFIAAAKTDALYNSVNNT